MQGVPYHLIHPYYTFHFHTFFEEFSGPQSTVSVQIIKTQFEFPLNIIQQLYNIQIMKKYLTDEVSIRKLKQWITQKTVVCRKICPRRHQT